MEYPIYYFSLLKLKKFVICKRFDKRAGHEAYPGYPGSFLPGGHLSQGGFPSPALESFANPGKVGPEFGGIGWAEWFVAPVN